MQQIGPFHCIVREDENYEQTIVLFHGFGADAYDLLTLAEVISTTKPTRWVFPQGILEVPIGPGWTGRAWWHIDMQAMQQAAEKGILRDISNTQPEQLPKLRNLTAQFLKQLKVPNESLILGGFSQGAMLAVDTYLHQKTSPHGLIIFSGNLICKTEWVSLASHHNGAQFFMSHGGADPLLPIQGARQLETLLTQAGMKGHLFQFSGGHEIPPEAIKQAKKYLESI